MGISWHAAQIVASTPACCYRLAVVRSRNRKDRHCSLMTVWEL